MRFLFQWGLLVFLGTTYLSSHDFPFQPPSLFTVNPKDIAVHHPVQTDQWIAQLYFDQGLSQLYAFNNDTAYWSFLNASKQDPQMPMAYWGMTMALLPNFVMPVPMNDAIKKAAGEAIQTALKLSQNGSEIEHEYILALSKRLEKDTEEKQKKVAYSQALEKLSQKYLDDPDAAVLWAASLLDLQKEYWDKEGKPLPGIQQAVNILETVMKKYPDHVGANHYYIHVMDGSPFPEKALQSAERLTTLLPNAGHLIHMPSHIYLLIGEYHKAALCSEYALAADREYANTYGLEGTYIRNFGTHNLYFLARIYGLEERFDDANQTVEKLRKIYLPHAKHMPEMEYFAVIPLFTYIHFHEWDRILQFQRPNEEMPLANSIWHASRAMAFAKLKNPSEAMKESVSFESSKEKVFKNETFNNLKTKKLVAILEDFMKARMAEGTDQTEDAISYFKLAVDEQNSAFYYESPLCFFSARQELGALFLKLQRYEEAEQIFRKDLDKMPNNSRSLFGLKESLKAQAKDYDYFWIHRAFLQASKYSDITLTVDNL